MPIVACFAQGSPIRSTALACVALLVAAPAHAADPGKAACLPDAKRLCAAEMQTLSRSRVRACLITHIEQTSPTCHDFMVKARAQALSGRKPDPSTQ
jgi:hypothetical protein